MMRVRLRGPTLQRRWNWKILERESLARFVNPACATEVVDLPSQIEDTSVFDLVSDNRHWQVAEAVYQQLAELGVQYDQEGYRPGAESNQRIRSPVEIVRRRRATCLDFALLYAGLALDLNLTPIVIVLEGHSLVAIKSVEYPLPITTSTTIETLTGWIKKRKLIPVEVIGATRGEGLDFDFGTAVARAQIRLGSLDFKFAIDVQHLQRTGDIPPEPCDRLDPLRAAAAALALLATAVTAALFYLAGGQPVFDEDVNGVAVASIEGSTTETGRWLARWLSEEGGTTSQFIDFTACNIPPNPMEVWGPDQVDKVDLDDQMNPSNIDLLVQGRRTSSVGDVEAIELSLVPKSTQLVRATDPLFFVQLPSIPAAIDRSSPAVFSFPELAAVPALLAGLRELERGDPFNLRRADCAFAEAQKGLLVQANGNSPRLRQFLATVDLLRANIAILQASDVPEEQEQEPLVRASDALSSARDRLTDPLSGRVDAVSLAIIDANEAGVILISLVTDDGLLESGVSQSEVDAQIHDLRVRAEAAQRSQVAFVALNTIAAKLSVAGARTFERDLTEAYLERAEGLLALAIEVGYSDPGDESLALQLSEAYHVRGQSRLLRGDVLGAAADHETAASLIGGTRSHLYRLDAAEIYWVTCQSEWESIVTAATDHYQQVGDQALGTALTSVTALDQACG